MVFFSLKDNFDRVCRQTHTNLSANIINDQSPEKIIEN